MLDASVLISYFGDDTHSAAAKAVLTGAVIPVQMHPVTLAEVLAGPARRGTEAHASIAVSEVGVIISHPDDDEPLRIARLRAATGLKLPDCYVLALAEQTGSPLATFDDRLATVARDRGVSVLGVG